MPTSKETRVRVEDLRKIMATLLPKSGWGEEELRRRALNSAARLSKHSASDKLRSVNDKKSFFIGSGYSSINLYKTTIYVPGSWLLVPGFGFILRKGVPLPFSVYGQTGNNKGCSRTRRKQLYRTTPAGKPGAPAAGWPRATGR